MVLDFLVDYLEEEDPYEAATGTVHSYVVGSMKMNGKLKNILGKIGVVWFQQQHYGAEESSGAFFSIGGTFPVVTKRVSGAVPPTHPTHLTHLSTHPPTRSSTHSFTPPSTYPPTYPPPL